MDLAETCYWEVFLGANFKYQVRTCFLNLLKLCYKETCGTISSEYLEYSLRNSLLSGFYLLGGGGGGKLRPPNVSSFPSKVFPEKN